MCHNENYWDLKESKGSGYILMNYIVMNFAILSATRATLTPQTSRLPDILTNAR